VDLSCRVCVTHLHHKAVRTIDLFLGVKALVDEVDEVSASEGCVVAVDDLWVGWGG
jgi:hypothetical protein